jgi:hypothetical protein
MTRSSSFRGAIAAAIALVAVLAVVASGAFGRGNGAVDNPAPTPRPSTPPTAAPSTPASPAPTDDLGDGRITIDLDVATPHDVSVDVKDETGWLVGAVSGRAGDGMSVRWYEIGLANLDDHTVRVTWVGFPQDEVASLRVYALDGKVALTLVSDGTPPNSDGLGYDRVVDLEFDQAIAIEDILVSVRSSNDTAD